MVDSHRRSKYSDHHGKVVATFVASDGPDRWEYRVKLTGKVALVTGAGRRIGRAISVELARCGCDLALHYYTSKDDAAETAGMVEGLGRRAVLFKANLAEGEAAGSLPKRAVEALGSLDFLVNNASTFEQMDLQGFSLAAWNQTLAVNVTAPMILSHAAHPFLREANPGRIVNLSDIAAERPWPGYLAYCVSKAGLTCLTQALAKAMAPDVRVNAVAPGAALFPDDFHVDTIKVITRRVPSLRAGTAEDVAAAVRFLITDADYVTGTILAVDGGRSIAW